MMFTLYVKDDCKSCRRVIRELQPQSDLTIINVNRDEEPLPPNVPIVPALFEGEQLLAYGEDILHYLSTEHR